jgi:hypothetical protein
MPDEPQHVNVFFRITIASGALFVLTIFALLAAALGNGEAPPARFLNEFGGWLIAGEVVVTLLAGFVAMAVDRRQTLAALGEPDAETSKTVDAIVSPGATGRLSAGVDHPLPDRGRKDRSALAGKPPVAPNAPRNGMSH